jgi:cell division protein FtsB
VAALPIKTWNYKSQDASVRHIGPMAQDFYAAFGLGSGDKTISTIDLDGVALAAIQGLHQENLALKAENAALKTETAALKAEVAALGARLAAIEQALRAQGEAKP